MDKIVQFLTSYNFEVQVFLLIFATLLLRFYGNKIMRRYVLKARRSKTIWDDALMHGLKRPINIVVLTLGFSYVALLINDTLTYDLKQEIIIIRNVLIVFSLGLFVLRFIGKAEQIYVRRNKLDKERLNTINAITKLLKVSVIITTTLILMQSLGINISGVLAFGGVSGIAVGFAAKDLLSNFFGAVMIYLDKPFHIGDWIRSPDKEIEGTVEDIGWRQTKIMTFAKRPIYVPNSVFSTITVENPSRMSHRRIYENIGVRYADFAQMSKLVADIKKYLQESKHIDHKQSLIVNFNKYADSALEIMVYCLCKETDWIKFHAVKQEVLLDIGKIIERYKAEIAYPTMTLTQS